MPSKIRYVGGADVAFSPDKKTCVAAIIVMSYPELGIIEEKYTCMPVPFPYIPGLLSFRESPVICQAAGLLEHKPDILLMDGQGLAHPRRIGLASHVGVRLGWPTIGCAKSRLIGAYEQPGPTKGAKSPLYDKEEIIGFVLRTRDNVKPLFISEGHLVSLDGAVNFVLTCCTKYRIPEPIRHVHHTVTKLRQICAIDNSKKFV